MTLSEQLVALEKRITELEQDNKRVPALEQENKRLHDTVAYLTKKLFGKSSEKTSSLSEGQMSLFDELMVFNEAEDQANPNVEEPDLRTEVERHCKKRYKGQRKDMLQNLERVKKVYHLATNERSCDICTTELVSVGEEFVRSE